jgi:hypothetical protein
MFVSYVRGDVVVHETPEQKKKRTTPLPTQTP